MYGVAWVYNVYGGNVSGLYYTLWENMGLVRSQSGTVAYPIVVQIDGHVDRRVHGQIL